MIDTVVVIGTDMGGYIGEVRDAVPAVLAAESGIEASESSSRRDVSKQGAAAIS